MKTTLLPVAVLALLVGCLPGCSDKSVAGAKSIRPAIYTTFHPTTCFAERIVGDAVPVVCPLPEGEDPIFWKPSREVLADYQSARLIVINGAELEKWVATVSLPESRVVDTARKLSPRFITFTETTTHSHGAGGEHTHEGIDGHTWLDPESAREQARAILAAAELAWPEQRDAFRAGHKSLEQELDALHAALVAVTEKLGEHTLVCSHPAYNYLGRRYGWKLQNLDLDPEEALDAEAVAAIGAELDGLRDTLLLWESEPNAASARLLADELGLKSVLFSPVENLGAAARAAGEDFFSVMNANVQRLSAALED